MRYVLFPTCRQWSRSAVVSLLAAALSFSAPALTGIDRTMQALGNFQDSTQPLLEKSQNNVRQYQVLTERLAGQLDSTGSGLAALRVAGIDTRSKLALSNASLAESYIGKFRGFQNEVDHQSACYRPEMISEFRDQIDKLRTLTAKILTFKAITDENEAIAAVAELGMHGVLVAQVPGTFQMGNLCFVEDAAPVLEKHFQGMDESEFLELAENAAGDHFISPSDEQYLSEPVDPFFPEDQMFEPSPDAVSPPISDIAFTDPHIEKCVNSAAKASLAKQVNDLTVVSCDFPGNATIRLDDLSHFPYLEIITLSGADLASLAPLGGMADLSQLMVKDSTIKAFGDLSSVTAHMLFSNVESKDWEALASSGVESIQIEKTDNCRSLSPLLNSPNIRVMGPEMDTSSMMNFELTETTKLVVTDCSKDKMH
ncbi:hypothetical protein NF212_22020 [Parasalinivibrio latis]|uniref:hypothetical protein n=1 Tax=Parasalinivibrio latis TaxID=2952610 RepID=UPI0030E5CAB7